MEVQGFKNENCAQKQQNKFCYSPEPATQNQTKPLVMQQAVSNL